MTFQKLASLRDAQSREHQRLDIRIGLAWAQPFFSIGGRVTLSNQVGKAFHSGT